jgi:hypothetical protein
MKSRNRPAAARRQHGVAAIELAMIIVGTLLLVPALLTFGSVYWNYNALQKGVHDANRYLSSVPAAEASLPAQQVLAVSAAQAMVFDAATAAGLKPDDLPLPSTISFICDGFSICGAVAATPGTIRSAASVRVTSSGPYEGLLVEMLGQQVGITLNSDSVQRYGD